MNWVHISEMPVGISDVVVFVFEDDVVVAAAADAVDDDVCASAEDTERARTPATDDAVNLIVVEGIEGKSGRVF